VRLRRLGQIDDLVVAPGGESQPQQEVVDGAEQTRRAPRSVMKHLPVEDAKELHLNRFEARIAESGLEHAEVLTRQRTLVRRPVPGNPVSPDQVRARESQDRIEAHRLNECGLARGPEQGGELLRHDRRVQMVEDVATSQTVERLFAEGRSRDRRRDEPRRQAELFVKLRRSCNLLSADVDACHTRAGAGKPGCHHSSTAADVKDRPALERLEELDRAGTVRVRPDADLAQAFPNARDVAVPEALLTIKPRHHRPDNIPPRFAVNGSRS
jgi:hypothetical protein